MLGATSSLFLTHSHNQNLTLPRTETVSQASVILTTRHTVGIWCLLTLLGYSINGSLVLTREDLTPQSDIQGFL